MIICHLTHCVHKIRWYWMFCRYFQYDMLLKWIEFICKTHPVNGDCCIWAQFLQVGTFPLMTAVQVQALAINRLKWIFTVRKRTEKEMDFMQITEKAVYVNSIRTRLTAGARWSTMQTIPVSLLTRCCPNQTNVPPWNWFVLFKNMLNPAPFQKNVWESQFEWTQKATSVRNQD